MVSRCVYYSRDGIVTHPPEMVACLFAVNLQGGKGWQTWRWDDWWQRHASKRNPWLWLSQECVSSQLSKPNYLPQKIFRWYTLQKTKTSMWKSHHFYVDHTLRTGGETFPMAFLSWFRQDGKARAGRERLAGAQLSYDMNAIRVRFGISMSIT